MKYLIRSFFCLVILFTVKEASAGPKDSLRVTTVNNKRFIMHRVDKGEGMLSIARRYNVSAERILFEGKKKDKLKAGDILLIPVPEKDTLARSGIDAAHANADAARETAVYKHKVAKGETITKIAQLYKAGIQDLIRWNNIRDNRIDIGQVLIVNPLAAISPYKPWNKPVAAIPAPVTGIPHDSSLQEVEEAGLAMVSTLSYSTLLNQSYTGFLLVTNLDNQKQVIVRSAARDPRSPDLENIILELDSGSAAALTDNASGKVLRVSVRYIDNN